MKTRLPALLALAIFPAAAIAQGEKATGTPSYKPVWKADLPKDTRRIAVADFAGDKKTRLLTLGKESEAAVYKTGAMGIEKEAAVDLGANASRFVVGTFAKGKPAIIAVPGAIFHWDSGKFARKEASGLAEITGRVRFLDGAENIFYFSGGAPEVWGVDLTANSPLTAGREMAPPDQGAGVYREITARLPAEILDALGVPAPAQKAGVLGFIDPRGDGKLFVWMPWQEMDGSHLVLADSAAISVTGVPGDFKPVWRSAKMPGKILDVAYGPDPRDGSAQGFYVLHTAGSEDQDRVVEFLELEKA